jgi:hypothetical protein
MNNVREVVINTRQHGGFDLSDKAVELYKHKLNITDPRWHYFDFDIPRDCPTLVYVVKHLGPEVGTSYSALKVVQIPWDIEWSIHEYNGLEWVAEAHRTWS